MPEVITLFFIGILLLVLNIKAIKKDKGSFSTALRDKEDNIKDYEIEIGKLRRELSENILELQKEIEELKLIKQDNNNLAAKEVYKKNNSETEIETENIMQEVKVNNLEKKNDTGYKDKKEIKEIKEKVEYKQEEKEIKENKKNNNLKQNYSTGYDNFGKKAYKNKNNVKKIENNLNNRNKVDENNMGSHNNIKINEIKRMIDEGLSVDEISEKIDIGKGEVLLIKELYIK